MGLGLGVRVGVGVRVGAGVRVRVRVRVMGFERRLRTLEVDGGLVVLLVHGQVHALGRELADLS